MSTFQVAIGHDNAAGLANVSPFQPRSAGLKYPARVIAPDGTVILKGLPYTEWIWDFQDVADYGTMLGEFGLSATTPTASALVTIKTLESDFSTFANYNATAPLPEPEMSVDLDRGKVLRVVLRLAGLEAL